MTARGRHRVVLADFQGKKRDEGAIDIELSDGSVVSIDPPELWSDEVQARLKDDPVAAAKALVGDADYERFVADGGSAATILAIFGEVHGTLGESSASSTS